MTAVTRRAALRLLPALGAAAVASPLVAAEDPGERVDRLMDELSQALREYSGDKCYAQVEPMVDGLPCANLVNAAYWRHTQTAMLTAWEAERRLAAASPERRASHHARCLGFALDEIDGGWSAAMFADRQEEVARVYLRDQHRTIRLK